MPNLHAGFACADITPPVGVAMAGYGARDHAAESIETPLTVEALVLESGGSFAAMAFTDLIAISPDIVSGVREKVSAETGMSADAIMVCGSHTHWGPEVRISSYLPAHLNECVLPEYLDCLTRTIAGAIIQAWRERIPAAAGWGSRFADGISFNRRPVAVDGNAAMNLRLPPDEAMVATAAGLEMRKAWRKGGDKGPRLSPPLEGLQGLRAGVSDPEIPLLKLLASDGSPLCALVNFACHPVVGGEDNFYAISPDYPFEARQVFQGTVEAPLAFSLGCAGDQVPAWRGGDSRVRVGRSLGAAAARQWYQIESCAEQVLVAAMRREVLLALKELPSVPEARRALEACDDPDSPAAAAQRNQLALAEKYEGKPGIETELWAVRVGDWAAVGLPGEILVEIGLQIKQQSPFGLTAVISLCNDSIGYISTAQAHREGGYEPTWSAPGPEAERQIVDAALQLLNSL